MEVLTQDQRVAELKERFRKLGIASYRISGMDEEESLLSYLREKDSFRYAFVREPYSRSKNLIWRLMKVDIWNMKLPMGYIYSPGFVFDYIGDRPLEEAIKIVQLLTGRKYVVRKMDDERISMRKVLEDGKELTPEDVEYLKSRSYNKIQWK